MSKKGESLQERVLTALEQQFPDTMDLLSLKMRFTTASKTAIYYAVSQVCKAGKAERVGLGTYKYKKEWVKCSKC